MVDLQEGATGAGGADRPDSPNGPPGCAGETFDLSHRSTPKPNASAHVTDAHGQRLAQPVVQRRLPDGLQLGVRVHPE